MTTINKTNMKKKIIAVGTTGLILSAGVSGVFANSQTNTFSTQDIIIDDDSFENYDFDYAYHFEPIKELSQDEYNKLEKLEEEQNKLFEQVDKLYQKHEDKFNNLFEKYDSLFNLENTNEDDFKEFDIKYEKLLEDSGILKIEGKIENLSKQINEIYGFEDDMILYGTDLVDEDMDSFETVELTKKQEEEITKLEKDLDSKYEKHKSEFEKLDEKFGELEDRFQKEEQKIFDDNKNIEEYDKAYEKLDSKFNKEFETLEKDYEKLEKKSGIDKIFEKIENFWEQIYK